MFINSKKCFEICEGENKLFIPRDFIGEIPDWAARHWMVQAAIQDGSIATPAGRADKKIEAANMEAEQKAEAYDLRPEEPGAIAVEAEERQPGKKGKDKA